MNYKHAGIAEIERLADLYPDYSLGQILHAITTRKPENKSIRDWLFNVSDEDLFSEIDRIKIIEIPES